MPRKRTDTEDQDWDWGFRTDAFWGTNARWAIAHGLEDEINGNYDSSMALPFPMPTPHWPTKTLTLKVGHFVSPVGYFTIDTTQNFFNTTSLYLSIWRTLYPHGCLGQPKGERQLSMSAAV